MTPEQIPHLSCWRGSVSYEPIPGGITNRNFLVKDDDESYFVRLSEDKSFLGIDRRNERVCQQAAAEVSVSPAVVHYEEGVLVSRCIEAQTLTNEDVCRDAIVERLAATVRQLHDARHQLTGEMLYFCPFQTVRTYVETARRLKAELPRDIDSLLEDAGLLSRGMAAFHPTLCHNDLLAANIMDDGQRLWLIDWEYAAIGNPLFDLASISANCGLPDELEARLLEVYSGAFDHEELHQVHVLKTVSLLREALWAVIQTVMSDIDFDYTQYARDNFSAYKASREKLDG